MHHLRQKSSPAVPTGSPPPTSNSPIVEYIKEELETFYPEVKDLRALAASSSAIALSIASPSCDPAGAVSDRFLRESGWRTAYNTAKIAVEIAKESSDMLPPLKAVVGALSILIQNYDQIAANAEQMKDIEERVQSLEEMFISPAGDQDTREKARRIALRKTLVRIVAKLGSISERHGLLKVLNNVDHANTLKGLVQDLANAVADYQTSIQRNIYENTKGIGDDTKRIDQTTRMTYEVTKRIEETAKKADINARNIIEAADLELLGKLEPVHDAGYQAGHHDTCLRGTRESVLREIMRWAENPQEGRVFWLNGLAGTGKSTITQTFSELVANIGTLGASFFCSRDYLNRRELKNIFPTLAYQLACKYPTVRSRIVQVLKREPSIAQNSLVSQLKELIVDPLSSTGVSCVIVIDALDECIDDQPASAILSVLGRYVKNLPSVKLFITGRPEPRIRTGFRLPLLEPLTQVFLLHGIELSKVEEDIRLYLREKLIAVAKRRSDFDLSDPWPREEDLTILTKKSSGLFIFASTLVRFIESEHHEPKERLQLIITFPSNTVHEGRAGVDPLYTQVLSHAFPDTKETTVFTNLRKTLGAVILAFHPLSREQIAKILGVNSSLIATALRHLHSVLLIPNEASKEIRIFHKSFPDFLQDHYRCPDPKFFIDCQVHHGDMALGCLGLLKTLSRNPCGLPDFVMNRDVTGLPELLEDRLGGATRYACGYWAKHVRSSPTTPDFAIRLIASATEFFKTNAIHWIEIMSLENRLEGVIHGIYDLLDWISMADVSTSSLRTSARDCLRFTMYFFHPIQQSAPHIYHTALPLSPRSSAFFSMILPEKTPISEFCGRPESWGAGIRTIKAGSRRFTCMATFSNRIAAACDNGAVGVYDSVTGALRLSLGPGDIVQAIKGTPDGSVLFCARQEPSIAMWDIQTGGLIHTFDTESPVEDIAICSKGRYIACGTIDGCIRIWEVANNAGGLRFWDDQPITHVCWLEPGERLVVVRASRVEIWGVAAREVLRSFTTQGRVQGVLYVQGLDKFAVVTASEIGSVITVIDPQSGTSFMDTTLQRVSCFALSQSSKELVCGVDTTGLELFNIPVRSWRKFDHPATITSVSTLPDGTIVANVPGSGIQLLNLDERYVPPLQPTTSALTVGAVDRGAVIAILPTSRDHVALLESATMSHLLTIPARTYAIPTHRPAILCASLRHHVTVCCFEDHGEMHLELWKFGDETPRWTKTIPGNQLVGGISPGGSRLVVLDSDGPITTVWAWDIENRGPEGVLQVDLTWPARLCGIEFESEDRFYSQYSTYRIPYVISWPKSNPRCSSPSIVRNGRLLLTEGTRGYYQVDGGREWVVGLSKKKICWIPPGYIGPLEGSYCWIGNTLVMAGQDGTLRKITFREPF